MNRLQPMLDSLNGRFDAGVAERLGWTLLHSVWQGAAVAALLAAALFALRRRSPHARHGAALAALALLAALPVATFSYLPAPERSATVSAPSTSLLSDHAATPSLSPIPAPPLAASPPPPSTVVAARQAPRQLAELKSLLQPYLSALVAAWLLGVAAFSLWHLGGWFRVRRIRRTRTRPLEEAWQRRFAALCERLRVARPVRLLESGLVEIPTVAGWLRPVILVPASALTGLPAHELEAILAHELAHVRRHDYLVCIAQAVVETLLFYHPAVWWVSAQVRREREDCCDDEAAAAVGNPVAYARALASLDELRPGALAPHLALAATGAPLLRRVRRLLGLPPIPARRAPGRAGSLAAAVLAASLACLPGAVTRLRAQPEPRVDPPAAPAQPAGERGNDKSPVFTLKGAVTDARTGKPIEHFRVVRAPADNGPGRRPASWQSHTLTHHAGGAFEIPLEDSWPLTRIRVDAAGYAPGVSRVIERQDGAVTVDVALEPAAETRGVVLSPDGTPVPGVQVTRATISNEISVGTGRMFPAAPGNQLGMIVATAEDGSFALPPEVDPGTIVATHFLGYAELPSDQFTDGKRITLQPWGVVRGTLAFPRTSKDSWMVVAGGSRPAGDAPYITHRAAVVVGAGETFELTNVAPGRAQVGVHLHIGNGGNVPVTGTFADIDVPAGGNIDVALGGKGRPVTGRVVAAGAVDWAKVKLRLILEAPHVGLPGDEAMWQAYQSFLAGPRRDVYTREFTPATDGTFRLENVPQGRYQLIGPVRVASRVVVGPMPGGASDESLNLGDLPLNGQPPIKQGGGEIAAAVDPGDDPAPGREMTDEEIGQIDKQMAEKLALRDQFRRELATARRKLTDKHPTILDLSTELKAREDEAAEYAKTFRQRRKADEAKRLAQYYIGGRVPRPGVYTLETRRINLLQALVAAGFDPTDAAGLEVQLFRRTAGEERETATSLPIQDLLAKREKDVFLQADDLVLVKPAGEKPANEPAEKKPRVLLLTPGDHFLERAVASLSGVQSQVAPADRYTVQFAAGFDVVILDRVRIDPKNLPPGARVILFGGGSVPPGLRLQLVPHPNPKKLPEFEGRPVMVSNVTVRRWQREHPILRGLAMDEVFAESVSKLKPGEGSEVLAEAGQDGATPMIVLHRENGRTFVVVPTGLGQTNWPLKVSFPVFMHQSVTYLAGA